MHYFTNNIQSIFWNLIKSFDSSLIGYHSTNLMATQSDKCDRKGESEMFHRSIYLLPDNS